MYMKNERMNTVRKIRILYIVDMMGMEQTYTKLSSTHTRGTVRFVAHSGMYV